MAIKSIHESVKNFYNQIEHITKDDPIAAIIYSIAIKIISIFVCAFSNNLGIGVFLLSLTFDIAIIANLKEVCVKIKNKFLDIIEGAPERTRARKAGSLVRHSLEKAEKSIEGFFEGLVPDFMKLTKS